MVLSFFFFVVVVVVVVKILFSDIYIIFKEQPLLTN